MSLKRNCTGKIEIEIAESLGNIKALEFIFKAKPDHTAETLLKLEYKEDNIPVKKGTDTSKSTTLDIKLNPSETFKLVSGTVYMDTRIVRKDGEIPVVETVIIDGVEDSLFEEVYSNEG